MPNTSKSSSTLLARLYNVVLTNSTEKVGGNLSLGSSNTILISAKRSTHTDIYSGLLACSGCSYGFTLIFKSIYSVSHYTVLNQAQTFCISRSSSILLDTNATTLLNFICFRQQPLKLLTCFSSLDLPGNSQNRHLHLCFSCASGR